MSGPGRCVCWSAAARPRDRHTRASLGVVDLEARPGPAAADQHRALALPPPAWHRSQVLRTLRRHGRSLWCPCLPVLLLVVPLVFRAPRGLSRGPGCLVRPWAAARPLAVRAASLRLGASSRSPARPCRRPRGTAARFSGPAGGLHTSGACCAEDDSPRPRPALALPPPTSTAAWPRHRPRVPWQVPRPLWHRGQARRSLRRSPVVCVFWIGSSVVDRNGASG